MTLILKQLKLDTSDKITKSVFGNVVETGTETKGHLCVKQKEEEDAEIKQANLLYGELLPQGLRRSLDKKHLNGKNAKIVFDLGMGIGKNVVMIFLEHPNIACVIGIELSSSRYKLAEEYVHKLVDKYSKHLRITEYKSGKITKISDLCGRRLEIICGNLFDELPRICLADIILFNVEIPVPLYTKLYDFFKEAKKGCRIMSYLNLKNLFDTMKQESIVEQLEVNKEDDLIQTSWSSEGCHMFMWTRCGAIIKDTKIKEGIKYK